MDSKKTQKDEKGKETVKKTERECIGCGTVLQADHTGIICQQDHHICVENGCSKNFVNHIMGEGPGGIPVVCMNCHCDVIANTFERQLSPAQLEVYYDTCVLVGAKPLDGEVFHRCPMCPNRVFLVSSDGDLFFRCNSCSETTCMICSAHLTRHAQKEEHLMRCGSVGPLRNELIEIINSASKMMCPECGHCGMKDDACTHITCAQCRVRWCYVCGESEGSWDGGVPEHNRNWEGNTSRCPMYLDFIHDRSNPEWPSDSKECVEYFHERKILYALKNKMTEAGRDNIVAAIKAYPAVIAPFTLDEVEAAEHPRNF